MRRALTLLTLLALQLTVGAVLLLSALPAGAQWIPACAASGPTYPAPAASAPPCTPRLWGGTGTTEVHTSTTGAAAALYCPKPGGGPPDARLYVVRWSALTPAMAVDWAALPFQPAASAVEFSRKYATTHVLNLGDVWCPARDRFNAAYLAATTPVQPAAQWRVAIFGVQKTRPAFAVVNGRRGVQTGRAPIVTGTPPNEVPVACDCAAPITEGALTYCPWVQSGGLVTVCTQRQ